MVETTSLFDLVLTGQLAQGVERASAVAQLALLFKMPAEKIEGLLASAPVVLKRDLGWEVAKRYRVAIKQAGALSDIRPAESVRPEAPVAPVASAPAPSPVPVAAASAQPAAVADGENWSLAAVGADVLRPDERAAPVSRLDAFSDFSLRPNDGNLLDSSEMAPLITAPKELGAQLDLLPEVTAVLAEHERALPLAALVDAPEYEVANLGERLSPPLTHSAQAPDTSHLTLVKS